MPMNQAEELRHRHTRMSRSECVLNVRQLKKEALEKATYVNADDHDRTVFGFNDDSRLVISKDEKTVECFDYINW